MGREYNDEYCLQPSDKLYVLSEATLYTKEDAEKIREVLNYKNYFFNTE
jgi:hypothetical protein